MVQVGMLGVIVSAIMVIMIGYLMVGISGYLAFPTTVEGNVLNSFIRGDIIMQVCHTLQVDSMLSFMRWGVLSRLCKSWLIL